MQEEKKGGKKVGGGGEVESGKRCVGRGGQMWMQLRGAVSGWRCETAQRVKTAFDTQTGWADRQLSAFQAEGTSGKTELWLVPAPRVDFFLFFGTRGKHLGAFVAYNALSSAAERKGQKREMFPVDMTTPARLRLVSILLTWPTHHLAPGASLCHTNQDHKSLAPVWHADLLFLTHVLQPYIQILQLLLRL